MKQHSSLQDERRVLLEQIHASRSSYRRMLMESNKLEEKKPAGRLNSIIKVKGFPQSSAINWLVQRPYLSVAAAAAVIFIGQKIVRTTIRRRSTVNRSPGVVQQRGKAGKPIPGRRSTDRIAYTGAAQYGAQPSRLVVAGRAAFTGLATVAAMLLRDPSKMREAARMFALAKNYVQERRRRHR
jgi:hypothetical protein